MASAKKRGVEFDNDPSSSPESDSGAPRKKTKIAKLLKNTDERHKLPSERKSGDVEGLNEDAEVTNPDSEVTASKTFQDLGIIDPLCEACEQLGFKTPTPIQVESIPLALQGRDVIGLAETGSGKTAAFALPILQALMDAPVRSQANFALVLAPTRELAQQSADQFKALGSQINVKTCLITGGEDKAQQQIQLAQKPHIIVATLGRLIDIIETTKGLSFRTLKYLVIDEADRLLDLDFEKEMTKLLNILPREGRRSYLFSATMSDKVESLQRASLTNPVRVSVKNKDNAKYQTVATLLQSYVFIPQKHKDHYLISILSRPFAGQSTIVFARTAVEVQRLTFFLRALGLKAVPIYGKLAQNDRVRALAKFKSQGQDILVATDVAARGLDIPRVALVLNYDLPGDSATYVHRVGRTARAGKSGHAISLVTQYDIEVLLRIEHALGDKKLPEYKEVLKDEAMVFAERVSEAQRRATREMKNEQEKRGKRNGGRKRHGRDRDEMDKDEG